MDKTDELTGFDDHDVSNSFILDSLQRLGEEEEDVVKESLENGNLHNDRNALFEDSLTDFKHNTSFNCFKNVLTNLSEGLEKAQVRSKNQPSSLQPPKSRHGIQRNVLRQNNNSNRVTGRGSYDARCTESPSRVSAHTPNISHLADTADITITEEPTTYPTLSTKKSTLKQLTTNFEPKRGRLHSSYLPQMLPTSVVGISFVMPFDMDRSMDNQLSARLQISHKSPSIKGSIHGFSKADSLNHSRTHKGKLDSSISNNETPSSLYNKIQLELSEQVQATSKEVSFSRFTRASQQQVAKPVQEPQESKEQEQKPYLSEQHIRQVLNETSQPIYQNPHVSLLTPNLGTRTASNVRGMEKSRMNLYSGSDNVNRSYNKIEDSRLFRLPNLQKAAKNDPLLDDIQDLANASSILKGNRRNRSHGESLLKQRLNLNPFSDIRKQPSEATKARLDPIEKRIRMSPFCFEDSKLIARPSNAPNISAGLETLLMGVPQPLPQKNVEFKRPSLIPKTTSSDVAPNMKEPAYNPLIPKPLRNFKRKVNV